MTRLFLARHGQTAWNASGRIQGTVDIALDATGRAQAQRLAASLGPHLTDGVVMVSSPLSRAVETAAPLAARMRVSVTTDKGLVERAYGAWEGLTPAERQARDPEEAARWAANDVPRVDGYEKNDSVIARARRAVDAVVSRAEGDVVVVSHASTLRVLMDDLMGWPVGTCTAMNLDNGGWSLLTARGTGWTLVRHNVVSD